MENIFVDSETFSLRKTIVGIANSERKNPEPINPRIKELIKLGTYPKQADLISEIECLVSCLQAQGVDVIRPKEISNISQIFSRDLGFVLDDQFVLCALKEDIRKKEQAGINDIIARINPNKIHVPSEEAVLEGGDVVYFRNLIFVGVGMRTNYKGYDFLKEKFPNKTIIPVNLKVSNDPRKNILHLDCAFQPIGKDCAIVYEEGIESDIRLITDHLEDDKIYWADSYEMYNLTPNILSINPGLVVLGKNSNGLKSFLNNRCIKTIEIDYAEVSKIGGAFRCSTLPLWRE